MPRMSALKLAERFEPSRLRCSAIILDPRYFLVPLTGQLSEFVRGVGKFVRISVFFLALSVGKPRHAKPAFFHGFKVAKIETFQLMAGNTNQRFVLFARCSDQILQTCLDVSAIRPVLIAHYQKYRVRFLPLTNFPFQLIFQIPLALKWQHLESSPFRQKLWQYPLQHRFGRPFLHQTNKGFHLGSTLPISPCFQREPIWSPSAM